MSNTITDSLYLSDYQKQQQQRRTSDLDKDAFLKILMTQLQNQDPSNPMEDKEFIAQMAQFTSLEQMTNMNTQFTKFIEGQSQNQFISNSQLIGKEVEWEQEMKSENGDTHIEQMSGIVSAVKFKNGLAELVIDNDISIATSDVKTVRIPENKEE